MLLADEITALRGGSQQRRNIAAKEPTDDLYDTRNQINKFP